MQREKTIKLSHKRTDHNHTELKLHFGSKRGKRHREVCPIRISLVHDPACNRFAIKSTEIVRSKQSNQTLFTVNRSIMVYFECGKSASEGFLMCTERRMNASVPKCLERICAGAMRRHAQLLLNSISAMC